jgi:hypothetical protein
MGADARTSENETTLDENKQQTNEQKHTQNTKNSISMSTPIHTQQRVIIVISCGAVRLKGISGLSPDRIVLLTSNSGISLR